MTDHGCAWLCMTDMGVSGIGRMIRRSAWGSMITFHNVDNVVMRLKRLARLPRNEMIGFPTTKTRISDSQQNSPSSQHHK